MSDACFGLIVEGIYDEAIYRALIPRILGAPVQLRVRACGGGGTLLRKRIHSALHEFNSGKSADKALVITDADDRPGPKIAALEQELAEIAQAVRVRFPRGVQVCIVIREPETWLMADEQAISSVASEAGFTKRAARVPNSLESIPEAKERFAGVLSSAGLPYEANVCARIAARADLDIIESRCPSFKSFRKKVLDC